MGGLFAAPEHVEAEQPEESYDAERPVTHSRTQSSPSRGEGSGGGIMAKRRTMPVKVIA